MIRMFSTLALLAFAGLAVRAGDSPTELQRLRVLLVIETNCDLGESVQSDRRNLEHMLERSIPASRLTITVLDGNKVTRANVLDHYRNLKTGPTESLLFYYCGHGAMDAKRGRYFQLQSSKKGKIEPLFRSEVKQAMEQKGAGLVVLMSDCCSSRVPAGKTARVSQPAIHAPAVRNLFFQHRGVVDITAAQNGTGSWGNEDGGAFTLAFCAAMNPANFKKLDGSSDGFVTWKEFFPKLQKSTEETFSRIAKELRARGAIVDQTTQTPLAVSLGEPVPGSANTVATPDAKPVAVFRLRNEMKKPLSFRCRAPGEEKWTDGKLDVGGKTQISFPLSDSASGAATLKLEFESTIGDEKVRGEVVATIWRGPGAPPADIGKEYKIYDKK